jgi:hypothetical protein
LAWQVVSSIAVGILGNQRQIAHRVLIHVDTERAGEKLVNRRLAYVAWSREVHIISNEDDD